MTDEVAAKTFAALGNPTRLEILRKLVQAGADGLTVGDIQRLTKVPASTLAHHLSSMVSVGIVDQEKHGREIENRVNFSTLQGLNQHLFDNCCAGRASFDLSKD